MLSFMAMDYFRHSPLLAYPLIALALFMLVFFIVSVRTALSKKSSYDALALMPLADEPTRVTPSRVEHDRVQE